MSDNKSMSPHDWFFSIQQKIAQSQQNTALNVNSELLQLYFEIGQSILDVQGQLGWGSQVIDQLSNHIKIKFPTSTGFSVRNLKYMRAFAAAYPDFPIVQVSLAQPLSLIHI